jgi:hypothetical protein
LFACTTRGQLQPPTTNHQPPPVNHQPSTITFRSENAISRPGLTFRNKSLSRARLLFWPKTTASKSHSIRAPHLDVVWRGAMWCGVALRGVAWCGVTWWRVAWRGVVQRGVPTAGSPLESSAWIPSRVATRLTILTRRRSSLASGCTSTGTSAGRNKYK